MLPPSSYAPLSDLPLDLQGEPQHSLGCRSLARSYLSAQSLRLILDLV